MEIIPKEGRTEEMAKAERWPCIWCGRGTNDGFCNRCIKKDSNSKPSEFYLMKFRCLRVWR